VLAVGNYCYVAVCSAAEGASAPMGEVRGGAIPWQGEERGGGIPWRPPAHSLFYIATDRFDSE